MSIAPGALQRVGLGYRLSSQAGEDPAWMVAIQRIRAAGHEVRGEILVQSDGEHVLGGAFNVSSLTTRATTARLLAARVPRVNWGRALEQICIGVIAAESRGPAAEVIGDRRPDAIDHRLLGPILPVGHATVLFGPGGAGKSTLAAAVATSVSSGTEILPGWVPAEAVPVVVLDWEASANDWSNLIASVAEGAGIEAPKVVYLAMARPLADELERIAEVVASVGAALLIIDSMALALGTAREGADPADQVLRLHAALRHLGVTSLLVDHVAGQDLGQPANGSSKPYGSVYKVNAARAVWELRREQEPRDGVAEVMLVNPKANLGPRHASVGLRMVYEGSAVRFERAEVTAPELAERLPIHQRMRRLLMGGAMKTSEVASELRVPESTIRVMVTRHSDSFTRLPDGRVGVRA